MHRVIEVGLVFPVSRSGAFRARMVRLVQPARVEKVKGIVKSLKDSFGFIERADVLQDVSYESES